MNMFDLFASDAIAQDLSANCMRQLFHELGTLAHKAYRLDARMVADALCERESRGSTAMWGGVAIPHARLPGLNGTVGLFVRLKTPIDLKATDGQAVDLVFVILSQERASADHLVALARVSRLLGNHRMREKLRNTSTAQALYALITEPEASEAA